MRHWRFHCLRIFQNQMIDQSSPSSKNTVGNLSNFDNSKIAPHVHNEESLRQIINRLSRIEGHVRGIKTMVGEHRPCPEVLNQIAAVKGAISSVAKIILEAHLEECLVRAVDQGNLEAEIKELKDALNRFLP
jgi:CsoR family transcriptional regulator, copper-sensing transcriptional repressor